MREALHPGMAAARTEAASKTAGKTANAMPSCDDTPNSKDSMKRLSPSAPTMQAVCEEVDL